MKKNELNLTVEVLRFSKFELITHNSREILKAPISSEEMQNPALLICSKALNHEVATVSIEVLDSVPHVVFELTDGSYDLIREIGYITVAWVSSIEDF